MLLARLAVAVLLASAAPAFAVHYISTAGAPDPGVAASETLVVSFDAPSAAGIVNITHGQVITGSGSSSLRAAPAGTGAGSYQSIGRDSSSTFDFSCWSAGRPLTALSFYWGSIDSYNFVDFLNSAGTRVGGLSGTDLPAFNGNQSNSATNRRVDFSFDPSEGVTAVRLRSTGNAFEFDSIAASAAVPEPASWAMLITGFGLIGAAMRRRTPAMA